MHTDAAPRTAPKAGTKISRLSPPTPRAWPPAIPPAKSLNALAKNIPWLIGGAADLAPSNKTQPEFRRRGRFLSRRIRRAQHAFRRPRTRHGRGRQRHGRSARFARSAPHSSISAITCKPAIRLGAHHGDAGHLHLHARFHRRRRRRPDAPADRATRRLARHARHSRYCGPATPTKSSKPGKVIMQLR